MAEWNAPEASHADRTLVDSCVRMLESAVADGYQAEKLEGSWYKSIRRRAEALRNIAAIYDKHSRCNKVSSTDEMAELGEFVEACPPTVECTCEFSHSYYGLQKSQQAYGVAQVAPTLTVEFLSYIYIN